MSAQITPEQRRRINWLMAQLAIKGHGHPELWDELRLYLTRFAKGFLANRVPDEERAAEIFQSAWLRLMEVIHRYKAGADGLSFFSTILRNVIAEDRREHTVSGSPRSPVRFSDLEGDSSTVDLPAKGGSDPEAEARYADLREKLRRVIQTLPPDDQKKVTLFLDGDLDIAKAAAEDGCTVAAMWMQVKRLLTKVQPKLRPFKRLSLILM